MSGGMRKPTLVGRTKHEILSPGRREARYVEATPRKVSVHSQYVHHLKADMLRAWSNVLTVAARSRRLMNIIRQAEQISEFFVSRIVAGIKRTGRDRILAWRQWLQHINVLSEWKIQPGMVFENIQDRVALLQYLLVFRVVQQLLEALSLLTTFGSMVHESADLPLRNWRG